MTKINIKQKHGKKAIEKFLQLTRLSQDIEDISIKQQEIIKELEDQGVFS